MCMYMNIRNVSPIMAYARPAWFTHTTRGTKDRLAKVQKLALNIIFL